MRSSRTGSVSIRVQTVDDIAWFSVRPKHGINGLPYYTENGSTMIFPFGGPFFSSTVLDITVIWLFYSIMLLSRKINGLT